MNSLGENVPRLSLARAVQRIGDIYSQARDDGSVEFLLTVAGCSQSGKTLAANSFSRWLLESGITSRVLAIDDFFFPTTEPDPLERARSFDLPTSVDFDLLVQVLRDWREGRALEVPYLEYVATAEGIPWTRRRLTEKMTLPSVVIVEGIFAHYRDVADLANVSVFVEGPAEALRLRRRIARDVSERGFSAEMVERAWESFVEPGCRQFVSPDSVGSRARIDLIVENDDE